MNIIYSILILVSSLFSQINMNYSYELQYGNGQKVRNQSTNDPIIENYSYFQNILDVNTHIGENIYVFTQLEYSKPPIYGYNRTSLDSTITSFFVEFSNERFNMKIGDQYELYGRGLVYYSFQDQNIDYDNSLPGISLSYYLRENLKIASLLGSGEYSFRKSTESRIANHQFETDVGLVAIEYDNEFLGYFNSMFFIQKSLYSDDLIENLCGFDNELGHGIKKTAEILQGMPVGWGSCEQLKAEMGSDVIHTNNYNLNWSHLFGPFDIYFDKSWISYDKIHDDKVFGSRFYASLYFNFFGAGITYEHKNYYTPYLLKSLSNPPIVFKESSSILASRNSHSMNFGNEIGHQLEINKSISESINIMANFSISYRHKGNNMESVSFNDILSMEDNEAIQAYYPFRQTYVELNGWIFSDLFYYKIGLDQFMEYLIIYDLEKDIKAFTIPAQGVFEFQNGSSLTMYLEMQNKIVNDLGDEFEYDNQYLSLSYSHYGKWITTGFFDQEIKDGKSKQWLGYDFSWKINTNSMVSLFYGSQKGGLVCANGICAEQPGFKDGLKLTLRSLF